MKKNILILIPTENERLSVNIPEGYDVHLTGTGSSQAGVETFWAISHYKPKMVIMAGLAGRYSNSELKIGDSVLVSSELTADCGAFFPLGFIPCMRNEYLCPWADKYSFPTVKSASVNVCCAPFIMDDVNADIENMEGAGFFTAAAKCEVPFLELRTISNTVTPKRDDWDLHLAAKKLNEALNKLLNEIEG